ncbi:shikimate dehydrogenase family protein [Christiangramia portivictoriae]|uniref:shikimate dehydrogenase family protein n=1 Tax=Christiangramia portivictoriae TaxID=326069 RepID=UPI0004001513|nr:shikimate dehydrogenase [Christiangramia portivictoriae]
MRTFGLVGKDIDYSFSRNYFSRKFSNENINARYINFDLENINQFPEIFKTTEVSGMNVTIPYKEKVIPFLDQLDPEAEKIGAVNTIKISEQGELTGYNTDHFGFQKSLEKHLESFHTSALILGTGGASKAVAYALDKLSVPFTFISRIASENSLSYDELNVELINSNKLVINTTPLGTFPDTDRYPPIPLEGISSQHLIFDLIYNPEETMLMQLASQRGAKTINGYQMLELQAEKSWSIWNT